MGDRAYAVIGWGSLIWDLEILAPHVELPWQMAAGPPLPMEFSRISAKRKMGLAVCLDPEAGELCPTHAIASRRDNLMDAIDDLAARERAPAGYVGGVCLASGRRQGRSDFVERIEAWCGETGWTGAVWTDLNSNFLALQKVPFTVPIAIEYLQTLKGERLEEAVRYIANAPEATDTPLRRALARNGWWQEQLQAFTSSETDDP